MAFPTVVFNSTSGSDSQASGAGPGTALFGTAASYAGSVFTLDGSPDLSGVATDGSHVIWVATSTGRQFFTINAKDNVAKTVTVDDAPAGTSSGLTWGLGGKRQTLDAASSRSLFGATGFKAGWTVDIENAANYTLTSKLTVSVSGSQADGVITIKSSSGSKPIITSATSGLDLIEVGSRSYLHFKNLKFTHTGASRGDGIIPNVGIATYITFEDLEFDGCLNGISGDYITDYTFINCTFINCEAKNGTANGFLIAGAMNTFISCFAHDNANHGLFTDNTSVAHVKAVQWILIDCAFTDNGGKGISYPTDSTQERWIYMSGCVIANNTSDGINIVGSTISTKTLTLVNCIIYGNGGWGVAVDFRSYIGVIGGYNAYGANVSGDRENYTALTGEVTLSADPFTNAAAGDYSLNNTAGGGASCREAGIPGTIGTLVGYKSIGMLQLQSGGGGGSTEHSAVF